MMRWRRYCYREVLPFTAMVAVECTGVGLNTLFKAATSRGLSYYVFIAYTYAIATLILLPLAFVCRRRAVLPPLGICIICKICLLGLLGFSALLLGYRGLEYSSPTLASAMSNLTPAFTFILAVFFRFEKLDSRGASSVAKIMGTLVSISGAVVVVLYKGPAILTIHSKPSLHSPLHLSSSDWILGGLLLASEFLLISIWYIVQAQIMKVYPAELVVVFLYNLSATIISAPVCLVADMNLNDWKLSADITLVAVLYGGVFGSCFPSAVHTWGLRIKGPVYVSLFRPFSIAIAAVMGFLFLGENLYLGSVVGALVISLGFYAAMWGKAREETGEDVEGGRLCRSPSPEKDPLLQNYVD